MTDTGPPPPPATPGRDRGLRVAACLVAAQCLTLIGVTVVELSALSPSRAGLGIATATFFAVCGLGLGWAARGLWEQLTWARGPVVMAQLLMLGVAWSTRATPWAAIGLAAWALTVLVLVLRPPATRILSE